EVFASLVTERMEKHPRIHLLHEIVTRIPEATEKEPVILATGPLTGDELAEDLARVVGGEHLAYYDAIAPIVAADSIAWDKVFKASRWGKGGEGDGGDEAYVNCPFDEAEYKAFVAALVSAEKVKPREFEDVRYFEGCLPVEVMASRGEMTLSF